MIDNKIEIKNFIETYVKAIQNNKASLFIGSGLSIEAGYPSWKSILKEKAEEIGLDVDKESYDLISLAQYCENECKRTCLDNLISNNFCQKDEIVPIEKHNLLAALPIHSYWTTNYDNLIEQSLKNKRIKFKVLSSDNNITTSGGESRTYIHKLHGDFSNPQEAVLSRKDYEKYDDYHEIMLSKLKAEFCSNTFLFLGYSFSDPNIHHILARIRKIYGSSQKQHYCFMKKLDSSVYSDPEELAYNLAKQEIQKNDFLNYGIKVIFVNDFSEINMILKIIIDKVNSNNILISGAYEDNNNDKIEISNFTKDLIKELLKNNFTIYTGFGKNLGSDIVQGCFDSCVFNSKLDFNDVIKVFPFPYNSNISIDQRKMYYTNQRKMLINKTKFSIIICGEKNKDGNLINSPGVFEEAKISYNQGNIIIPVPRYGGAAKIIFNNIINNEDIVPKCLKEDYLNLNNNHPIESIIKIINYHINNFKNK